MPKTISGKNPPHQAVPFSKTRNSLVVWLPALILVFMAGFMLLIGCAVSPTLNVTPRALIIGSAQPTTKFPSTWTPSSTFTPIPRLTATPSPSPSSTPFLTPTPTLPASAEIHGIVPHKQSLPLDCESNDATLLAGFFGYKIDELEFQNALPKSDNPNLGFVGDVNGVWGSTPPVAYGVHASPVAITLRSFHVPVLARFQFPLSSLKRQIADGNPVMIWVVGHVEKGKALPWKSSDGYITYVAPYEHTVLVIGYDDAGVTILDNLEIYGRNYNEFMDSWSVLGYMAIIKYP